MSKNWRIPRRSFLKGLGVSLALPALDAMVPPAVRGATPAPRRMAFVYLPNGMNMEQWTPSKLGAGYDLPPVLEPLRAHQSEINVLSGLAHTKARANGDGAGDHARANATFLTGVQARKTSGADIHLGISADQVAAQQIGSHTRLPSLELSCDRARMSGSCDSGYSCIYQYNISWRNETTPMPGEANPRAVFERLFGTGDQDGAEGLAQRQLYRKSILDYVMHDARQLRRHLGVTDRAKLEQYMTAVREIEQQIQRSEQNGETAGPGMEKPDGIPREYKEHIRLMYDLLALAFRTDSTRIATFMVAHDGSNRPYPEIGVSEGHHNLSHHGNDPEKKAKIAKINRFHTEQLAHFLAKMKSMPEGEGTVLDNSMIVFGCAIADGQRHTHHDLPVLLAGRGGGTLTSGRHIRYGRETPMTNLFLSMFDGLGVRADRIGDSTGRVGQLA